MFLLVYNDNRYINLFDIKESVNFNIRELKMNLKELKQLKTIKAIRHDKNFVSTDDFIKDIENKILKENYQILSKDRHGKLIEYMLLNPDKQTEQKIYLHDDDINNQQYINELINRYKKNGLTVLKTYIKDNFLYIVTKEHKTSYEVILKADYLKQDMQGVLYIRSKDYIFKFIDDNNMPHELQGEYLKADMIQDNKIILNNSIEYILQV